MLSNKKISTQVADELARAVLAFLTAKARRLYEYLQSYESHQL